MPTPSADIEERIRAYVREMAHIGTSAPSMGGLPTRRAKKQRMSEVSTARDARENL
jgi:uncharacterized protein (DUF1786 family)